jgi:hypothetical protein
MNVGPFELLIGAIVVIAVVIVGVILVVNAIRGQSKS